MRFRFPAVAAFAGAVALAALPRHAAACAGCRNPNLPITRLAATQLAPGQVRASALLTGTTLNVIHEAGCADAATCHEVPVQPPFLHDQDIYPGELRAVAELGLTTSLGIEAQIPFRITRTRIRYATPQGAPYQPLDPEAHHRNETLAGFGDLWLLGRWGRQIAGTAVTMRVGSTLPVGRTQPDPFALGAQGLRHQHIQFGNGTFDPLLMIDLSRTFGRVDLSWYGQTQINLYENSEGFRAGTRLFSGVQAGAIVVPKLTAALGIDVLSERPERWAGKIQQDGNLGRTELLGGISITRPFGSTVATAIVRFPIYRHIVSGDEPQGRLSAPVMLSVVLSRTFGRAARP